jgi:segregation and condensation protein B
MDEISRELPTDQTNGPALPERQKGPEELQAQQRSSIDADLVVRDRLAGFLPPVDAMTTPAVPPPADEPTPPPAPVAETPVEPAPTESPDPANDTIDSAAAAAAVAAEADTAEIEEDLGADDEEGLPPVPELTDATAVARMVFVLMTTSRESLSLLRLAQACNTTQKLVEEALGLLQQQLTSLGLPIELARNGDSVKWMTGAETFVYLQRLRGVKKIEKLSPAALETLAVIAYRQPVMRSEIEGIRGVKAGPMLRTLLHHKLVKVTGRSEVPGRPLQYGTTPQFLERFGLVSLQELPSIKEWKSLG